MRYLVFIFKGFNTRTINVYHGKIMNSKGIQNQVQNKVLPGRRALTARGAHRSRPFRVVARASVWACVPAPVHTYGSLCVQVCACAHALGMSGGRALRGVPFWNLTSPGVHTVSPLPPPVLCPHIRISEAPAVAHGPCPIFHSPHRASAVPDFLVVLGDGHVSQLLHDGRPA